MEILGYSLAILGKIMKTSLAALLYQSYERSWCTQLNVYLAGYYLTLKVWKSLRLHKALSLSPVLMLWWKLRYWGYHCPITDPSTHNNNNGTWFFFFPKLTSCHRPTLPPNLHVWATTGGGMTAHLKRCSMHNCRWRYQAKPDAIDTSFSILPDRMFSSVNCLEHLLIYGCLWWRNGLLPK